MARGPRGRRGAEPPEAPLFEVCVPGLPVSGRAKNRALLRAWKERVRAAAVEAWPADLAPLSGEVELRVTHYHAGPPVGDTDNLIKPVQDASQGVVYENDRQVRDGPSNRRDIDGAFRDRYMSPRLAAASGRGDEFVHVRIRPSPAKEELG